MSRSNNLHRLFEARDCITSPLRVRHMKELLLYPHRSTEPKQKNVV